MTKNNNKEVTQANGYPLGRPEGRNKEMMDILIERAILELPYETRLYPDVYAWRISEILKKKYNFTTK